MMSIVSFVVRAGIFTSVCSAEKLAAVWCSSASSRALIHHLAVFAPCRDMIGSKDPQESTSYLALCGQLAGAVVYVSLFFLGPQRIQLFDGHLSSELFFPCCARACRMRA